VTREELEITTEQLKWAEAARAETAAGVAAAKAALDESKALYDKAGAKVGVAEAGLRVAQAERDRAAALRGYARIEAPFDGVLARRYVDTGAYVQAPPADNKTAGTPLFEVVRTDAARPGILKR
jgi:multidrug resistance efflux pump